jgi:DNA-binding LacI/PurR family transcriptional regulator
MALHQENSSKKFTALDVARRAGVSKWTVSRAFTDGASIAPGVRERIRKLAVEMGYSPNLLARSLSKRSTSLIALVADELANPNQLYSLNEATRQLQAHGLSSLLLNISPEYRPETALRLADQFQVDGVIFLGTTLTHELIEWAQRIKHIPLVVVSRNSGQAGIPFVSTDGYAAGAEIADLFLAQGYQRIGYMAGPLSERTELRRMEGFRDQLGRCGIRLATVLETAHYRRDEGMHALLRYLESTPRESRLQALFCESDILAIGAMDALVATNGQRKLAVVGFDDIEMAASPSYELTTFRQPVEYLIGEAIRLIVDRGIAPQSVMAPGSLVLRNSHRCSV